jgi:signal transduction histidine kinase
MENNLLAQLEETDLNVNFEKIIPKLQAAIDEVRRISMDLRPSLLDDIGIMATLKWFIRETRLAFPSTQFDIEMHGLDENTLTPELKTAIFRIVQEAINNASKHSRARIIRLGLKGDKQNFTLEIADDGCGFPVDEVEVTQGYRESKGLGIASMRERAMSCGGSFSIESKPDAGTRIKCVWSRNSQLPLDKRKAVQ